MSASANPTISRDDTVTIAIMGATGSGKSTFVNRASNSRLEESGSLESCTDNVVVAEPFLLDGKVVTLIDTPGFDDTTKTEAEVLGLISAFLSATYKQGRTLNGVIYMQNITIHRMGGMARKNFRLFRKLCGDATLKNVLIATNMWSDVNPTLAAQREREMAEKDIFFKSAIEKGARMVRHDNTVESAHRIIREIMGFTPAPLQIQRETVDENKPLPETDAGQDVKAGLEEQLTRYKTEVAELRGTIQELLQAKDDKHREDLQELREAMRDLQGQLTKVQAEAHRLREEHEASRREYEEKMGRMAEAMAAREAELRMAREHAEKQRTQLVQMENALQDARRRASEEATLRDKTQADLKAKTAVHQEEIGRVRGEAARKAEAARRETERQAERERVRKEAAQKAADVKRGVDLERVHIEASREAAIAKREAELERQRNEQAQKAEDARRDAEVERLRAELMRKAKNDMNRMQVHLKKAERVTMDTVAARPPSPPPPPPPSPQPSLGTPEPQTRPRMEERAYSATQTQTGTWRLRGLLSAMQNRLFGSSLMEGNTLPV